MPSTDPTLDGPGWLHWTPEQWAADQAAWERLIRKAATEDAPEPDSHANVAEILWRLLKKLVTKPLI